MGILDTLLSKTDIDARPIFNGYNCLNKRQRRYTCTICQDLCPEKIFLLDPKAALDWKKCSNCGLCVSSCPSRCFAPDRELQRLYTTDMDLSAPVSFSCDENELLTDKKVECLASIPWEMLAVLALHTELIINVQGCESCEIQKRSECLLKNLGQLESFFGEEEFARRIHIVTGGEYKQENDSDKVMSRRKVFSDVKYNVTKSIVNIASSRIPFLDEVNQDGLQYRQLLSKAVMRDRRERTERKAAEEKDGGKSDITFAKYGVSLPAFTDKCYGCGICEKMCPQKALEIGEIQDGQRLIYITPWKCTGCGLCEIGCPHGGISGIRPVALPYLEKLPLVRVNSAVCENCGFTIKPDTEPRLCPSCARKQKKQK